MKNEIFQLEFDEKLGGITRLSLLDDSEKMNFIKEGRALGSFRDYQTQSLKRTAKGVSITSKKNSITVQTEFRFEGEYFCASHILKNDGDPVYFKEDLRVTIQALGWRSGGRYLPLQDDISSVAYWYSDNLEDEYPPLPDKDGLEII